MKVVINNDWGGFDLSDEVIALCIERGMSVSPIEENYDTDFVIINDGQKQFPYQKKYDCKDSDSKDLRSNPILIQAIEELEEEANTIFSKLKIIDIPFESTDGWEIYDYEGVEEIHETHRSWS